MKLHDVGCAANAHGCTRNDADDIALTDQPLFQQTFLRKAGQGVDFLDVHDAARRDTPEEGHAPTSFHFRRKRNDWDERAVAGYQPRGEAAVCEYSDESHVQLRDAWQTDSATVSAILSRSWPAGRGNSWILDSAASMMRAIMPTASTGYLPV